MKFRSIFLACVMALSLTALSQDNQKQPSDNPSAQKSDTQASQSQQTQPADQNQPSAQQTQPADQTPAQSQPADQNQAPAETQASDDKGKNDKKDKHSGGKSDVDSI